jgi:hypothetical protein
MRRPDGGFVAEWRTFVAPLYSIHPRFSTIRRQALALDAALLRCSDRVMRYPG